MNSPLSREAAQEALDRIEEYGGNVTAAAQAMELPRATLQNRRRRAVQMGLEPRKSVDYGSVELPEFPDDDIPVEEIIDLQCRRFAKQLAARNARQWFPIKVKDEKPIGLTWFGDPHIDDAGCNLPLLRHHCELHAKTEGLYGANIGDTTNNWVGRLTRLFGDQESSQKTARRLAKWFLQDSGIEWLVWLMGNHDAWNEGADILRGMNARQIPMEDWQAQFKLVFPNGAECRIWASHDFPGHSIWNSLHGPQRAAHTKADAHLYVAGHRHNWALHQEESASREFTYWLARCRGYKFLDHYAELHGHLPQQEGASITAIIDPQAQTMSGFLQCFADLDAAVDYLTWKRGRAI